MADLAHRDWELWSTTARLICEPDTLEAAYSLVTEELLRIEEACSRFRPDSEVRRLQAGEWTPASPLLMELLRAALDAAEATGGAVDPTVGGTLSDLGYDRDLSLVERDGRLRAVIRPVPGWKRVELDGDRVRIPAGMELDLGATAKAVAADRCATLVARRLGGPVLVNIGGDLATVGGPEEGWQVLVQDTPDEPSDEIALPADAALATSSTIRRTWHRDGQRVHHIIDPASGRSAAPVWRTVSVAASTCAAANAAATATIVKGVAGVGWLQELGLPARLVAADGSVLRLAGWPLEEVVA